MSVSVLDLKELTSRPPKGPRQFIGQRFRLNANVDILDFSTTRDGMESAESLGMTTIAQDAYDEDVIMDYPKVLALQGGWNSTFTTCPSNTRVPGSLTIKDGQLVLENIILQ